jgi:uncharacterized protein (TIGR00369 family)
MTRSADGEYRRLWQKVDEAGFARKLGMRQFNINFLSAAPRGDEVIAIARQVHVGRRIAVFDFEVRDRENRLLAQGQATGLCRQET